ncbi:MAG: hypothetical protein GC196_06350 [Hyphomonas sp.]|nr:hypothetical protein [Hyphomonas sp.]
MAGSLAGDVAVPHDEAGAHGRGVRPAPLPASPEIALAWGTAAFLSGPLLKSALAAAMPGAKA